MQINKCVLYLQLFLNNNNKFLAPRSIQIQTTFSPILKTMKNLNFTHREMLSYKLVNINSLIFDSLLLFSCHNFLSLSLFLSPFSSFAPLLFPFLGLGGLLLPGPLGGRGRGRGRGARGGSGAWAGGIRITARSLTGISVNETNKLVILINSQFMSIIISDIGTN